MVRKMAMKKHGLVQGVGINDAEYPIHPFVDGKKSMCPYYRTWANMLRRCYNAKSLAKDPSYSGCKVSDEWLRFSNFKLWMETQDWVGKQLDKDILFFGNKVYSADTCVFVDAAVNLFILDRGAGRGQWPIGVHLHKQTKKFKAQCNNMFLKKIIHLGLFTCPHEAHLAWKKYKNMLANQIADMQEDEMVANAIRSRYSLLE